MLAHCSPKCAIPWSCASQVRMINSKRFFTVICSSRDLQIQGAACPCAGTFLEKARGSRSRQNLPRIAGRPAPRLASARAPPGSAGLEAGPGQLLFLDSDLRMHKTFDGQYFVQMRPEAYDKAIAAAANRGGARASTPTMGFADWGKGDRVATASHILVKDRETADAIRKRIEAGELAFEDAARQFSTCGSAAEGGDLGRRGRAERGQRGQQ